MNGGPEAALERIVLVEVCSPEFGAVGWHQPFLSQSACTTVSVRVEEFF